MITKIKDLFKGAGDSSFNSPKTTDNIYPLNVYPLNEDNKKNNETYTNYGLRICGKVTASLEALNPFLSKVYNGEKNIQVNDATLQTKYKQELLSKKNSVDNDIIATKANISKSERKIATIKEDIDEQRQKLVEAKNRNGELNKSDRVKMIIGLIILMVLTVYLVIFYSSTFYSAFFRDFNQEMTIGQAIFDSHAIPNALVDGFGEFMFIICAPIIFMGLGYGLHYFMEQKTIFRFVKSGAILIITFIFDCILAYLIAKKIYDVDITMKLGEFPDFSIKMAIADINVWAVIFCGFIVYIIWGIVFNMVMTAYGSLRSNKSEISQIEEAINIKKGSLAHEEQELINFKAQLEKLEKESTLLAKRASENSHYDVQIIKVALADFFSGWMTMMNTLNKTVDEQTQANSIYQTTITTLFPV